MAQTETRFVTNHDYIIYREKQDDDIRREFGRQASIIEKGNKQLRDDFNDKLSTVNGTLSGKLGELNKELGRVKNDLRDLKDEVSQVKDEVSQVKDEVSQVKDEVSQVKDEVAEIKARLNQMEGRSFNKSRHMPHHSIAVIGVYRDPIGFRLPAYFPSTINDFWKLKSPRHRENLFYLVKFYDIQGFQHWGQIRSGFIDNPAFDTGDSSSDESNSQSTTDNSLQQDLLLERAVEKYPEIALDELASLFGLSFGDIRDFFQRADEHQQQQRLPAVKRQPFEADVSEVEVVKRLKNSEPPPPKYKAAYAPSNTPSTKSVSEKLMWDMSASKRAHAEAMAKMEAGQNVSVALSEDSLTDVIPSQESRDFGFGKKKRSNKGS